MKILLLTDGIYPYVLGGMQKHSYYLAKYLAKEGVDVHVAHCFHKSKSEIVNEGADPEHYSEEELKHLSFSLYQWPTTVKVPGHYIRENWAYSFAIWKHLRDQLDEFDMIYAQGYTGWKFIKERVENRLKVPVWVNFHGLEMFQLAPNWKVRLQHRLLQKPTLWNMENADKVFSFGAKIGDLLAKQNIPKEKLIEMPIGIEENWLVAESELKNNDKTSFVFIGRYERRKGIEELNEALYSIISKGYSNFEVNFIGPIGTEYQIFDPKIIYHGAIYEQDKIKDIIRRCDVLLCPSHAEGMPTVIMEGMASGLAILATNVGAVSKQLDQNGWLLEEPNVELIEKTIIEAIEIDSEKLLQFKRKSLEIVKEKFLWKRVVGQLLGYIRSN